MKNYDWKNAFGETPEAFRHQLQTTLNGLEEKEMKKRYKLSTLLAAALIVAVALAGAGIAATQLGVFKSIGMFQPLEGAEELVGTNLGTAENEYAVLTVEEAVFDGQGVLVQYRLSPKDAKTYALLNSIMQDTPEEIYNTSSEPAVVDKGTAMVYSTAKGDYTITNEAGECKLLLDGAEVAIPGSLVEAEEKGIPVYTENGGYYYTFNEFKATSRKDGREILGYWINTSFGDARIEQIGGFAEEQSDGSIIWYDSFIAAEELDLSELEMHVSADISKDETYYPIEETTIVLPKSEAEWRYKIEPVDGKSERFEVLPGNVAFTKVRGYLELNYTYQENEADEPLGITFKIYDEGGNEITVGAGNRSVQDGVYTEKMEMQSLAEVPDRIWLEAKVIGEDRTLGRVECRLTAE